MSEGYAMTDRKMINTYLVILTLYEQQKYMWDNRVHSIEHRIVSLSQPWIRPIVRGKVKAPTESGAKFEVIIDEHGYARITRVSFEAFMKLKSSRKRSSNITNVPADGRYKFFYFLSYQRNRRAGAIFCFV